MWPTETYVTDLKQYFNGEGVHMIHRAAAHSDGEIRIPDHPLVKEIAALRWGPLFASYHEVLGAKLNAKQQAMLHLALSFFSWRSLVREGGLKHNAAVTAMIEAIDSAG